MRLTRGPVIGTLATCVALSTTLTGSAVGGVGNAALALPDSPRTTPTAFGLGAGAYGSLVTGGDVPAHSGRTASVVIGCTKLAGKDKSNRLSGVDLGQADLEGVSTRTWTTRDSTKNGVVVSARAMTRVASADLGPLSLRGLRLSTRAYHDDDGFHTERDLRFADIDVAGSPITLPLNPDAGETFRIPGLGRVVFLDSTQSRSPNGARVFARGLQVKVSGSDTNVTIANATSLISSQVPAGILGGYGRAADVRLVDGKVVSGKIANEQLPCQGTDDRWRVNDTAGFDLPGVLEIGAASGSARGDQVRAGDASGITRGRISRAAFGDRLVIGAIRAQAEVTKDGSRLTRSTEGTTVGFIRVDGENRKVPDPGETLTIRRVAKITVHERFPSARGIRVVAARVELLYNDPSIPGTVNLGEASVRLLRN